MQRGRGGGYLAPGSEEAVIDIDQIDAHLGCTVRSLGPAIWYARHGCGRDCIGQLDLSGVCEVEAEKCEGIGHLPTRERNGGGARYRRNYIHRMSRSGHQPHAREGTGKQHPGN